MYYLFHYTPYKHFFICPLILVYHFSAVHDSVSHPLIMTVRCDKDEVHGQIVIPLSNLPSEKYHKPRQVSLQPHKKCPDPEGELAYDCYVSKFHAPRSPKPKDQRSKTWKKMKKAGLSPFKALERGHLNLSRRNSRSLHDLTVLKVTSENDSVTNTLMVPTLDLSRQKSSSMNDLSHNPSPPEILSVSPERGSTQGSTRITIVGEYLGRDKSDIISLLVCGANCIGTLEYESTTQIVCTTAPCGAGPGFVVVETKSGGMSESTRAAEYIYEEEFGNYGFSTPTNTPPASPLPLPNRERSISETSTHKKVSLKNERKKII